MTQMGNGFLDRPRRWPLLVVAGAVAMLLAVAAGLVIETAASPHQPDHTGVPAAVPPPGSDTGITSAGSPAAGPLAPLHLLPGSHVVYGVSVGFPHSAVGAVSAAASYMTQLASTLDPDRAASVMRLVADPSYRDAAQQSAQGVISERQQLGLPASGPVPAVASLVFDPAEYQILNHTRNQVTVLLLADYVITQPGQGSQTRIGVYPLDLHWTGGDWSILAPQPGVDYSGLTAQPGSAQAAASGWQRLAP
jgi:hypothetical protein